MATRNRRSRTAPRRRLFWAQTNTVFNAGPTAAPVPMAPLDLLTGFQEDYGADLFGFTITRIRGLIRFAYDNTDVVERHDASFGIRVADERAVLNSDGSEVDQINLSPSGDPHADWMWIYNDTHYTATAATSSTYPQYLREIDIKAQRRLDELGRSLFMFGAFAVADFQSFVNMTISLRVLCKRP